MHKIVFLILTPILAMQIDTAGFEVTPDTVESPADYYFSIYVTPNPGISPGQ